MDNGPSENPHTDTMITNMDNGDGGAVSTGEAADAGDAGNRREEPDATRDSETEPAARVETVSRPRTPMGASETAAPARAKEKAVHFSGRVLRFATVGLSEAELAAAAASDGAPKMPTQTQCQVAFGEPHVITEVRLVPKGLKPMQNLAPEQEHWIGNTVPGTFDLTVFYATPVPKGEAPAEGPRPQKWESLNKKMLKYNEKNRVQSLYTWKFTGQNVPICSKTLLFRGNFQSLSVCILGKTLEEWKAERREAAARAAAAATVSRPVSPPSSAEAQPNGTTAAPQSAPESPPSRAEESAPRAQMSPQAEDAMDVDEEAKSRRRMSVSSSTSSPLVRGPKGRDSIGDKLRELPKTLSLAVVRNAALANVTTPTVSIPDLELWTSAIATITELLGNRLDFEAGLSAREAWGAKLAGALTAVRDFVSLGGLAQDIAADLPVLCQALEFALDTNSGCMTKELLVIGIELTTKLVMEGGEVADAIVDSGILRSLLRLLRDPLSTLPLRLHLIDLIEKLMVEPAACRFLSSAVPGQDDVAPSEWDSFADLFIAIVTRIPMPNMFLDSVGMVLQKLAVYEALKRLAELSDCEEAPAEAAEGALDEIVECVNSVARAAVMGAAPSSNRYLYNLFRGANLTGTISRILATERYRTLATFGSDFLPALARLVVAICLDQKGLEYLGSENAESGFLTLWATCLVEAPQSTADESFDADEVRRCPGIFTASCLVKPLFSNRGTTATGMKKAQRRAEAATLLDTAIQNTFLTYLEPSQIPILAAYTLHAAGLCSSLIGADAVHIEGSLRELDEMTIFDVGREAVIHVLAGSKEAFDALVAIAADVEAAGNSKLAIELLSHFVQHPLALGRLKQGAELDALMSALKPDGVTSTQLTPWLSVLDLLKGKGMSAVLDLVVKPVHPTATDLADPQVVLKMTVALSVLLQGLIESPPQILGCRISGEELAGLETRRGLLERILGMLSRASEILIEFAEPVTSVRNANMNGAAPKAEKEKKQEVKLEDLRAEKSRASSPTPHSADEPARSSATESGDVEKVAVQIKPELIQLRRQILNLLFILIKLLKAVMMTAYDAGNRDVAVSSRPTLRKLPPPRIVDDGDDAAESAIAQDRVDKLANDAKIPRTPLYHVVPTLLDVLSALNFVDIRGADYAGGALLTPQVDTFHSTGTIVDEYQSNKIGDFYVVARAKQTVVSLISAMSGAVMFEVDGDGMPIDGESSLVVTRRASLLGGFEDGYGRQTILVPRFMEPATNVFSEILTRFAWKEPGKMWTATQLLNEILPAPVPVYADLDSASLRDYLARLQDDEDVYGIELSADLEAASGGAAQQRTYLAKGLLALLPQLLELVRVGAASSTRQLHLAIRTLVLRLLDLDVDDTGIARGIVDLILDRLDAICGESAGRQRRLSQVSLVRSINMDGLDTVMDSGNADAVTPADSAPLSAGPTAADSKLVSEASRWLSLLCAVSYLPSGRALLLCGADREGKPFEKRAKRVLALVGDLLWTFGSANIATDLALETLQWIFSGRPSTGEDFEDSPVFWDPPEEEDVVSAISLVLASIRDTRDERLRSQLFLLLNVVADSANGARAVASNPEARRTLRELVDSVLDLLAVKPAAGGGLTPKVGIHELDIAISLMSTLKSLTESSTKPAAPHFLFDGASIAEHEERVLRLNVLMTHAQELMELMGQKAMQMAEKGLSFDEDANGILDPGLCASLAELTGFLLSNLASGAGTTGLTAEDLMNIANGDSASGMQVNRSASMEFDGGFPVETRKRTFAEMMWSRPTVIPSTERSELYMADLEDESAAPLFESSGAQVDLEAMAKSVLPDLSLRKKLRYSSEISLADITRSKFQRHVPQTSGGGRPERKGKNVGKQPSRHYKAQEFRSGHVARKANTSRAPSVHVDDFLRGGSGPVPQVQGKPTPTGKGDRRQSGPGGGPGSGKRQGGPGLQARGPSQTPRGTPQGQGLGQGQSPLTAAGRTPTPRGGGGQPPPPRPPTMGNPNQLPIRDRERERERERERPRQSSAAGGQQQQQQQWPGYGGGGGGRAPPPPPQPARYDPRYPSPAAPMRYREARPPPPPPPGRYGGPNRR